MAKPPYMSLRLFPNRSLSRSGFRWLMLGFAALCLAGALRFMVLGAWPVVFFLLLDILLLYGAFRLNYIAGRAFEDVVLEEDALTVRQVSPHGRERLTCFDPHWVKVAIEELSARQNRLLLVGQLRSSGGDRRRARLSLGQFLSPAERRELKTELDEGLHRFRSGEPYAPSPRTSPIA